MDNSVVIEVTGRLTVGHDAKMRQAVYEALDAGARNIVLDLERVNRVDSSGIGELVSAHTTVRSRGGRLLLAGLGGQLATVLQITHLMGVLETFEDMDAALAALADETS